MNKSTLAAIAAALAVGICLGVGGAIWARPDRPASIAQTQTESLNGVWVGEGHGAAMTIIMDRHAIFLLVNDTQAQFASASPTESEMAHAYQAASSASLNFDLIRPGRWSMEFINATDPSLKGVRVEYDYEWLNAERTRLQYWVLDEHGTRTQETGISRRIG